MYWKILTAVLCFYAVVPVEPTASSAAPTTTGNATTTATAANTTITAANNITTSANTTTTAVPTTATAANTTSTYANNITTSANTTTTATNTTAKAANTTTTAAKTSTPAANNITTAATTTTTADPTTTTAAPTTTPSPPVVFDLVFRSDEVFSPALTNTSSPSFQNLVTKTIQALEPLFKAQFPNFIRLIVVGFRNGSIITDTQLEFAAANTTANATTPFAEAVATTLKAAITNGSLSINISANFKITVKPTPSAASPTTTGNETTTTTAVKTTTTAANTTTTAVPKTATAATTTTIAAPTTTTAAPTTTPSPPVVFDLVFRSDEVFSPALTNTSSLSFQNLVTKTIQALEPLFKAQFPNFIRLIVVGFRNGSIITDTQLEFAAANTTANATTPFAEAVATTLKAAITNGSLSINISANFKITVKPTPSAASPTTTGNETTTTTAVKTTTTAANTTTTAVPTTTTAVKTTTTAANTTTTAVPKTATAATTTTIAAPTTTTAAPTTTPSPPVVFDLVFRSDEVFSPALTNTSSPSFQNLVTKTIQALEPLFKAQFPNFIRLIVVGFRNGSIITDTQLEFAAANTTANATTPFAEAVATTLKAAITNGSLSINISANFKITVKPTPSTASPTTTGNVKTTTTAANTTTTAVNTTITAVNTTTTAANTTTTAVPKTATAATTTTIAAPTTTTAAPTTTPSPPVVFDLVFRSDEVFSPALTNTSSPSFQNLKTKTIQALEPLFKAQFANFIRLIVVGFRNGSIITDTQLEFAAANTTANATTLFADAVATTLKAAITNGSLSINISANFKITVKQTPSAASPTTTGNATTTTTAVPTTTTAVPTTTTAANTTTTAAKTTTTAANTTTTATNTTTTAANTTTTAAQTTTTAANTTTTAVPTTATIANTTSTSAKTTTTAANNITTAANTTTTAVHKTATAANTATTAAPTKTTAAPTTTPSLAFVLNLVFRSDEVFSPDLTNTSSPLFQSLATKTIKALEPLFKAQFPNFIRLIVVGFRNGSIITDTQLEFAAANTTANATTPFADAVASTLKAAITNGSLSINISANFNITVQANPTTAAPTTTTAAPITITAAPLTITAAPTTTTAAPTTTTRAATTTTRAPTTTTRAPTTTTAALQTTTAAVAPTTTAAPNVLLLVFSSDETFTETLSNNTSQAFRDRATTIKNAIEPFYRKFFRSFIQLVVLSFRRGSVITECRMEFGPTGNGTAPTANSVKDVLVEAVNKGNIDIRINASSIVVSVLSSSMSPVVNSVFSSFGMTLVFLLLSAAMHRL
ncbi:mucin-5AC-like isoform X5 [Oncorhynchus keta]|uniref:mucin-5AC-like isoform X3 n=1 Tax=Oncorhynchus keta TaxID=8018 RepID=UPI00227BE067|nr:mucin-5AC-like isoform X3 [Oncorhynchus keta]XP_052320491.1 mucin-5AC-like isoform X4 [Oncorhynchus keta]XP_052320492.1 mucin-5AC-like isoform X5 [Oncorhynchus keta]